MITRHVKILIECEVSADKNPTDLPAVIAKNFTYGAFTNVEATLISASELEDPFKPINETPRKLRARRRISRFFLRRLGLK
jgi:hypothetical protein